MFKRTAFYFLSLLWRHRELAEKNNNAIKLKTSGNHLIVFYSCDLITSPVTYNIRTVTPLNDAFGSSAASNTKTSKQLYVRWLFH